MSAVLLDSGEYAVTFKASYPLGGIPPCDGFFARIAVRPISYLQEVGGGSFEVTGGTHETFLQLAALADYTALDLLAVVKKEGSADPVHLLAFAQKYQSGPPAQKQQWLCGRERPFIPKQMRVTEDAQFLLDTKFGVPASAGASIRAGHHFLTLSVPRRSLLKLSVTAPQGSAPHMVVYPEGQPANVLAEAYGDLFMEADSAGSYVIRFTFVPPRDSASCPTARFHFVATPISLVPVCPWDSWALMVSRFRGPTIFGFHRLFSLSSHSLLQEQAAALLNAVRAELLEVPDLLPVEPPPKSLNTRGWLSNPDVPIFATSVFSFPTTGQQQPETRLIPATQGSASSSLHVSKPTVLRVAAEPAIASNAQLTLRIFPEGVVAASTAGSGTEIVSSPLPTMGSIAEAKDNNLVTLLQPGSYLLAFEGAEPFLTTIGALRLARGYQNARRS
ncbi:hypothetical protein Emag_003671 [Eimeria magna]